MKNQKNIHVETRRQKKRLFKGFDTGAAGCEVSLNLS